MIRQSRRLFAFSTWFFWLAFPLIIASQEDILDRYIAGGLAANLALKQKEADFESSLLALDQARSHFFPSLSIQARYTRSEGGRIIEFPVGDLLNPVYNTLNLLTASQLFPEIENQSFRFYRPKEHETKLQLMQPLFSPEIFMHYRLRKSLTGVARADMDTYRRQLVADIKTAYYGYRKVLRMEALLTETRVLLEENIRVNRKLVENHKATIDAVYRSEAELAALELQEAIVNKQKAMAISYLNFLLNREPGTAIETGKDRDTGFFTGLDEATRRALEGRKELEQLDFALEAAHHAIRLYRGNALPQVFTLVDYGFQGETYGFGPDDDFLLASVVLRWNLFSGFENKARVKQAVIEKEKMEYRRAELERQIEMEVESVFHDMQAALKSIQAAGKQIKSSREAFDRIERRYREGNASLIEFMDARNQLTLAGENLVVAEYEYLINSAEYERVTASYVFGFPERDARPQPSNTSPAGQ